MRPFVPLTRGICTFSADLILPLARLRKRDFCKGKLPIPSASMRVSPPFLVLNLVLAGLFGLFAWLQRNDIDPAIYYHPSVIDAALWFAFYLLIAVLFVILCFRRLPRWLLVVSAIACNAEIKRS